MLRELEPAPEDLEAAKDLLTELGEDDYIQPPPKPPGDDAYPDWDKTNTRVISGPLGPKAKYPGARFDSWRKAQETASEKYRVVKFWVFASRWFARIRI